MIIDAHTHLYRPEQMPTADPNYLAKLPVYRRLLFTPTKYNHTRQGWATCDQMIGVMDAEGIDRVVILGPMDEESLVCYRRYPDRLLPFKYLDMPRLRKNRKEELLRMRRFIEEEGFVGFGEHHPDLAGNELSNPDVLAVMDLACELGVPVNFHVSEPLGHFYYGKSHNPVEEYFWLVQRYPDLRIVMSHWGGGMPFFEIIPGMRPFLKNVYYDAGAARLFYDIRKSTEQIIQMVDPHKLFYGSDFPLLLQPKEYPNELDPRFIHDRCDFLQCCVTPEIMDGLMGDNFAALIGLTEARSSATPPVKPVLRRQPCANKADRPYFSGPAQADSSVFLLALQHPGARDVFDRHGIPWNDTRVNPWLGLIQPLAQNGVWFEEGVMDEVRALLPEGDPLRALDDLDLAHEKIRTLSARYPAMRPLFDRHRLHHTDVPVPPWETVEQAAARRGIWPPQPILDELNIAIA